LPKSIATVTALAEAIHMTSRDDMGILIFLTPYAIPTINPSELTAKANKIIDSNSTNATPNSILDI
jgi:hypothetical protein